VNRFGREAAQILAQCFGRERRESRAAASNFLEQIELRIAPDQFFGQGFGLDEKKTVIVRLREL
jgi:hypothetical protein